MSTQLYICIFQKIYIFFSYVTTIGVRIHHVICMYEWLKRWSEKTKCSAVCSIQTKQNDMYEILRVSGGSSFVDVGKKKNWRRVSLPFTQTHLTQRSNGKRQLSAPNSRRCCRNGKKNWNKRHKRATTVKRKRIEYSAIRTYDPIYCVVQRETKQKNATNGYYYVKRRVRSTIECVQLYASVRASDKRLAFNVYI